MQGNVICEPAPAETCRVFAPPRAAYIHIPFCARRCGYCNFTVVAGRDDLVDRYFAALERELSWLESPRAVDTLFFGGGTPTQLGVASLRRLLRLVMRWFPLAAGYELTVEANPADITAELAQMLAEEGVTRVSLGAQSFDAPKLRVLERDHAPQDICRAVELLRGAGTSRAPMSISLDLIFGTPGESLATWRRDLQSALDLAPDHLSTYGLTYERGTTFWGRLLKGDLARLEDELERSMYSQAIESISAAGLAHYEVSNFARPGHRCRHNEVYWAGRGYFAAGPGAARYVDGRREVNHQSTTTWIKRVLAGESPVAQSETLEPEDRAREMLVLGLRRREGVDRARFVAETGFNPDDLLQDAMRRFADSGLLETSGTHIRLTADGLLVSDAIWPYVLRR